MMKDEDHRVEEVGSSHGVSENGHSRHGWNVVLAVVVALLKYGCAFAATAGSGAASPDGEGGDPGHARGALRRRRRAAAR